jgi:hypothetical protein
VWLHETLGDFNIDRITATSGDVDLWAHQSILDASTATGESSAKPGVDIFANNVTLKSDVGAIGVSGNDIDIDSARNAAGKLTTSSSLGTNLIEVTGDLTIDQISTGSAYTAFIAAPLGNIFNGRATGNNVVSGKTRLFARNDIGTSTTAFKTAVGALEGVSELGRVFVTNTGAMTIGGVTAATSGLVAKGSVTVTTMSPMTAPATT